MLQTEYATTLVTDSELLAATNLEAMLSWLEVDPWPATWDKRLLWLLDSPFMVVKLVGGGLVYWWASGPEYEFKQVENRVKESRVVYGPSVLSIGLFLLFRPIYWLLYAMFLPVKSFKAISNRSENYWLRLSLKVLSVSFTVMGWLLTAAFFLPLLLPGAMSSLAVMILGATGWGVTSTMTALLVAGWVIAIRGGWEVVKAGVFDSERLVSLNVAGSLLEKSKEGIQSSNHAAKLGFAREKWNSSIPAEEAEKRLRKCGLLAEGDSLNASSSASSSPSSTELEEALGRHGLG